MKIFNSIFILFLTNSIFAQTVEDVCSPGFNRDGHCGFYREVSLTTPQAQRATTMYIGHWTKDAYKDYSNLSYNKVKLKLEGGSGGSTLFSDVIFQLLDANDLTFQTIPALIPPSDGNIEQEIILNGASKLRVTYTGPFRTGDAGISEITDILEPSSCDDILYCDNGNIGIGTTAPIYPLDVQGNIRAKQHLIVGGELTNGRVYVRDANGGQKILLQSDGVNYFNSGNVGIGTTTPQSKLAVNGQIRATEVKVLANVNDVPDYVFEPEYELRSLKETKEYIAENKHLPEIPSAAEIGENGIDLGDMNMRLLKKIEELTLYQIQLLEKMEQLQEKVEKLENK